MTERSPASTATAFIEAFGSGDLDATLALLHDNVVVDVPGDPAVPWTGRRHGHAGAAEFFGLLGEHLEPEAFGSTRSSATTRPLSRWAASGSASGAAVTASPASSPCGCRSLTAASSPT
jgi:ketosteroid isomerase-like protein